MKRYYYDPSRPGGYGGAVALQRGTKLKPNVVKNWLSHQDTYTLHKPIRRRFKRRRIIVGGIDHQFQADLIDLRSLKTYNDGFSYLLTCIDVFSKFAWAIPLMNKTGKTLVDAMSTIFHHRQPMSVQADKGSEFVNRTFLGYLKKKGVHFFTTENEDIKAAVVERFNRTLKEKMWRYFTKTNKLEYVKVLPSLLKNYNKSYHRSIKMSPIEVNVINQEEVWNTLYSSNEFITKKPRLVEGARVRIALARRAFKKGYTPSWTEEMFTVSRINKTTPITYVLKDYSGEELKGSFYEEELQNVGDKQVYRIESIIAERRGGTEYLVKWFGYPTTFNSWVSAGHVSRYRE